MRYGIIVATFATIALSAAPSVAAFVNAQDDALVQVLFPQHVESFAIIGKNEIVVGHRDELLLTTNNGGTWAVLGKLPERTIIKQIVWIDRAHLVVNASYTGRGILYYTSDGAKSFKATLQNTGSSQPIVWDTAGGTLCAVHNSNYLYVSTDKGRTWHRTGSKIPFGQRPNVSHFCSLTSIFERGRKALYATTSYPGQIIRSLDTGRHWSRLYSDSVILRNREIPMLGKLSDGRYFAVSAEGSVDAPGYALIGSRSGRDWSVIDTPEGMWYFGEVPNNPGHLLAAGFSLGRRVGDAALFVSSNYGRTWQGVKVLGATLVWQIKCLATAGRKRQSSRWVLATDKGLLLFHLTD